MTFDDGHDPLLRALARLPAAPPDEARAARVHARCATALEHARLRREHPGSRLTARQIVEAALVGAFCVFYLSAVLHEVARSLSTLLSR